MPGEKPYSSGKRAGLLPGMDQIELWRRRKFFFKRKEPFCFPKAGMRGEFDFKGIKMFPPAQEEVYFLFPSTIFAKEIEFTGKEHGGSVEVLEDKIFKKAPQEVFGYFPWVEIASQITGQTGIKEVEFGAFSEPFGETGVVRPQPRNQARGLKKVEIARSSGLREPSVPCRLAYIKGSSDPGGKDLKKTVKIGKICHLGKVTQVSFQIGSYISPPPETGFLRGRDKGHRRGKAFKEDFLQRERGFFSLREKALFKERKEARWAPKKFRKTERTKFQIHRTARQGLRHSFHKQEIGRTGKDYAAGTVPIHGLLYVKEKFRGPLNLIQDHLFLFEKDFPGPPAKEDQNFRIIQGKIGPLTKRGLFPEKGTLPYLAGPGKDHHRRERKRLTQKSGKFPGVVCKFIHGLNKF